MTSAWLSVEWAQPSLCTATIFAFGKACAVSIASFGDRANSFFNRNFRVDPMLIKQVDNIDAEPVKTPIARAPDVGR
jgi:hypothetical protein